MHTWRKLALISFVLIGLVAVQPVSVSAQNGFLVTTTDDAFLGPCDLMPCTLRVAVYGGNYEWITYEAPITIWVPAGTYTLTLAGAGEDGTLTGDMDILGHITIIGEGIDATIIDGADLDRVLHVHPGASLTLNNLTIRNGKAPGAASNGGGILNDGGTLILNHVAITGNEANISFGGGGISARNGAISELNNCRIEGNHSSHEGGGISNVSSTLSIDNCVISGNTIGTSGTLGGGGLLTTGAGSSATILYSRFSDNVAARGGGIYSNSPALTISSTAFTNNRDVAVYSQQATITGSTFVGNQNVSFLGGGGGAVLSFENLSLAGSTFVSNTAAGNGGGVLVWRGTADITNNTFVQDTAVRGAAIYLGDDNDPGMTVTATISHNTLKDNSATTAGGGVGVADNATVTLFGNILDTSTNGNCSLSPGGSLLSTGYNLSSDTSCAAFLTAAGDLNSVSPGLGTLGDYGGTSETIPPQPGSPSIDAIPAGSCGATTDQRGVPRPQGPGCEMGAFEGGPPQTYTVTKTADTYDGVCDGDCSLREAFFAANNNPNSTVVIPAGTYILSIAGVDEDMGATGDLDIRVDMTITGADAATTIIDGADLDRVMHITRGQMVSISGVTLRGGRVTGETAVGAGILNDNAILTLHDSVLTDNELLGTYFGGGGGLAAINGAITTLQDCTVLDNHGDGGGILNDDSALTIDNCSISDNTGGGLATQGEVSSAIITNSRFTNNLGHGSGGGIFSDSPTLMIARSTFVANRSSSGSPGGGGALYLKRGSPEITNNTFANNIATYGGAIYVTDGILYRPTAAQISHNTFVGNRGHTTAGGLFVGYNSSAALFGNIFDANIGGNCGLFAYSNAVFDSQGYNLSSDNSCAPYFFETGDQNSAFIRLGTLGDYGGFTQTIPPLPGSPATDAIPAGNCAVTTDQRGIARPQGGGCDSGAYEGGLVQTLNVTKTADTNDGACDGDCSLREAVLVANAVPGRTIFLPAGTYTLSVSGTGEDAAATGDLDITAPVTIIGAGGDGNSTIIDGGNIDRVFDAFASLTLHGVTVRNGQPENGTDGGGIRVGSGGILSVNSSILTANTARNGGAIDNSTATGQVSVNISTISGNTAQTGGGIHNAGVLNVANSTLSGNSTTVGGGGGIANTGSGTATITASTIHGNTAGGDGGGILNSSATATLNVTNTTIVGNTAVNEGGGVDNYGSANLHYTTVVGNSATIGGGVAHSPVAGTSLILRKILLAENVVGQNCFTPGTRIVTQGYNLSSDISCTPYFTQTTDRNNVVLPISALGDYGGVTQTIALLEGNPAIDLIPANQCFVLSDQRGTIRPQGGGCDSGAFEVVAPPSNEAPERNYHNFRPTLTWVTVPGAAGYEVQVATDSNFANVVWESGIVPEDQWWVHTDHLPGGRYYWRARAVNGMGIGGNWSESDTFIID